MELTKRETEIIELLSIGMTAQEIGNKLFVSKRTVETHRHNIFRKMGVDNVVKMINRAYQEGILKVQPAKTN